MKFTIFAVALAVATLAASEPWSVSQAVVSVKCPMTIGGSFDAKTTALTGSLTASRAHPPTFDGRLSVDLRTLDTGISLRNDHLREKYLEVDKGPGYGEAVLSEIDLTGLSANAQEGKGSFTGVLMLHGVKKTVGGPAEVRRSGPAFRVKASFPVNLSDYNIPEPRYLGVGVRNTVQVEVTFTTAQ